MRHMYLARRKSIKSLTSYILNYTFAQSAKKSITVLFKTQINVFLQIAKPNTWTLHLCSKQNTYTYPQNVDNLL